MSEMRLDYFLGNLLFGMILLTAFMALAHLLGDLIVSWLNLNGRNQKLIRLSTLISCGLMGLLLFLIKLANPNLTVLPHKSEKYKPFLVSKNIGEKENEHLAAAPTLLQQNSWSLVNVISDATLSEEANWMDLFKSSTGLQSLVTTESSEACQGWIEQLERLNLKIESLSRLQKKSKQKPLIICATDPLTQETNSRLVEFAETGGSILLVGAMNPENVSSPPLASLNQGGQWLKGNPEDSFTAKFGGLLFTGGGLPSLFRLDLGSDWVTQNGYLFAESPSDIIIDKTSRPVLNKLKSSLSPFLMNEFGRGRIIWTSLPGHLSKRLQSLYGETWNLITARIVSELFRWPNLHLQSLPSNSENLVLPIMISQFDNEDLTPFLDLFHSESITPTYFLPMTSATEKASWLAKLKSDAAALGTTTFLEDLTDADNIHKQLFRFFRWIQLYQRILPSSKETQACCSVGGTLLPDAPATAIAAAIGTGFQYLIGDPFMDSLSPYRMKLVETRQAVNDLTRVRLSTKSQSRDDSIVILPAHISADYAYRTQNKLSTIDQILKSVAPQLAEDKWAGTPFILPIHSHIFTEEHGLPTLKGLLADLKAKHNSFWTVPQYLEWFEQKSKVKVKLIRRKENQFVLQMQNPEENEIKNLALHGSLNGWHIKGIEKNSEALTSLDVSEIKPGQNIEWVIEQ